MTELEEVIEYLKKEQAEGNQEIGFEEAVRIIKDKKSKEEKQCRETN
jgi:hypothetical protein